MADFLTAVSTKKVKVPEPLLREVDSLSVQDTVHIDSAKSVIEALRSQPNQETVSSALRYMTAGGFSLLLPEPLNASIAHQLVNDTIPHYWRFSRESPLAKAYANVLRNPTGIGHIITRLRSLIADSRQKKAAEDARDPSDHIQDLLEVLDRIFRSENTSSLVLRDVLAYGKNVMQKKLIWREYLAQIASGRVLSIVAEAEDVFKSRESTKTVSWLADGNVLATWLGRNIAYLTNEADKSAEYLSAVAELSSKALTLGYTGESKCFKSNAID
jgi:telomere length regulation protein